MLQTLSYIINVAPEGVPQVVRLSQNENGRTLSFTLTGAGTVNIPSGSTVTISGTKPDGVVYSQTGTISGTTASFPETTQMTAVSGIWPAKIKVTYNGETIATCKIVMAIDPDPVAPGSVPSSSQLSGLVAEAQQYATYAKYEAFGSPLVAATAAAMTDKTRVYVYTGSETGKTAGHWYYWNGSAWTDGGVYNSQGINTDTTLTISGMAADSGAVGAEFTRVKQDINELEGVILNTNLFNKTTILTDARLSHYGSVIENATGYYVSDWIEVDPSTTYIKNSPIKDEYHRAAWYNVNKAIINVSSENIFTTTPTSKYVRFCGIIGEEDSAWLSVATAKDNIARAGITELSGSITNLASTVSENKQEAKDMYELTGLTEDVSFSSPVSGKYIASTGAIGESSGFAYVDAIPLQKGDTIRFTGRGYQQNIAMIAEKVGTSYTPLVVSIDSTVRLYSYTATHDCAITLSYNSGYEHSAYIIKTISSAGFTLSKAFGHGVLFPRLAVIGDSLSSGEMYVNNDLRDIYGDSWLSYIARYTNADARNHYSQGGMMASTWITTYMTKMQSDTASNAYFIALGTNDKNNASYPLGNISDVAGSDSFVGYYKQIIEAVHTKAPNAVIFCVSLYNNGESHHTWSNMISAIADLYSYCFYVDFINESEIWVSTGEPYVDHTHFTTIGYNYVAGVIYQCVCKIVDNNPSFFKFFGYLNSAGGKYEND